MDGTPITRRRALKVAGLSGTALLAGCVASGSASRPVAWLPEPSPGPTTKRRFWIHDVEYARNNSKSWVVEIPLSEIREIVLRIFDEVPLPFDQFAALSRIDTGFVIDGDFDAGAVSSNLKETGMEESGSYGGFRLFRLPDGGNVLGVGDCLVGTEVSGGMTLGPRTVAERLIDAKASGDGRWIDEDDTLGTLVDGLGDGYEKFGWFPPDSPVQAAGQSDDIVDGRIRKRRHFVFESVSARKRADPVRINHRYRFRTRGAVDQNYTESGRTITYNLFYEP